MGKMKKIMKKMLIMSFIISMVVSPCSTIMAESTTMTAEQFKEMINNVKRVYYGSNGQSCTVGENIGDVKIEGCKAPEFTIDHLVLNDGTEIREPFPFTIKWVRGKSSETNDGFKKISYSLYAYCGISNCRILTVSSVDTQKKNDKNNDVDEPQSRLLRNFLAFGYFNDHNYMFNDKNKKADLHNLVINSDDKKKAKFKSLNKKLFTIKNNKYLIINNRMFKTKKSAGKYKSTYYHGFGYLQVNVDGKEIGRILVCEFPDKSIHNEFIPHCTSLKRVGKNKVKLNLFYPKKKYDVTNVKGLKIKYSVEVYNGKKVSKQYENVGKSVTINVKKSTDVDLRWSSKFYVEGFGYIKTHGMDGWNIFTLKKSQVKKMKLNKKYTEKSLKKNKIKIYL